MFLELTQSNGNKCLVNTNQITSIHINIDDDSRSNIIFNSAGGMDENYITVLESYYNVYNLLCESANILNK